MAPLVLVEVGTVGAAGALAVADHQILDARRLAHVGNADTGGPGTVDHDTQSAQLTIAQPRVVHHAGQRDDRRAPLIIMEDGNIEHRLETILDLEAGGSGDVLEVDAAIHRRQRRDGVYDALRIGLAGILAIDAATGQRHGPGVDIAEGLEEHRLALHHRHAGQRAQIAEPQDCRAVRDHRHQIAARGVVERLFGRGRQFLDRLRHAGRIGQAEIPRRPHGTGQTEADLAAQMKLEDLLACNRQILCHIAKFPTQMKMIV